MTILDIVTSIYRKTKTNSSSYIAANMLIDINNAYEHVVSLIMANDAKWQWDDGNNTDLPIATTALVSGQQDYGLAVTHLTIDRIELLPSGGTVKDWIRLTQLDQQSKKRADNAALTSYQYTNGKPLEYDLVGNSIFLYPAPNYSQAASLKIYFTRGPALFTSAEVATGAKVPGFNALFHDLIPLWVAYNNAVENELGTANGFLAAIQLKEAQLIQSYGKRNRDFRGRMSAPLESNK